MKVFKHIERILELYHINDNKAVYIFDIEEHDIDLHNNSPFALMFKDGYVIIGTWGNVVNWHGNAINTR